MACCWYSLPAEIKSHIFDYWIRDGQHTTRTPLSSSVILSRNDQVGSYCAPILKSSTKTGFIRYATVCKDWQAHLERKLYRHLSLRNSSLHGLEKVVRRQQLLVEHIEFLIELPTYHCNSCLDPYRPFWSYASTSNDQIVGEALTTLFRILRSWYASPRHSSRGRIDAQGRLTSVGRITLEIGIYSPSDWQHNLKPDVSVEIRGTESEDPRSRWDHVENGSFILYREKPSMRSRPPPLWLLSRVMEKSKPSYQTKLPSVKVIKTLLMRRRFRRHLQMTSLQRLLASLPNLENLHFEPCRLFRPYSSLLDLYNEDRDCSDMIINFLPERLKTLTIFEDFNEVYDSVVRWDPSPYCLPRLRRHGCYIPHPFQVYNRTSGIVSAALALRSLDLEHLSASYLVDANEFFNSCHPDWHWAKLESLALTSRLLGTRTEHSLVTHMLVTAGKIAAKMPQLELMEIWYGLRHNACVFRYCVAAKKATLAWSGTWNLDISPEVVSVWSAVAKRRTGSEVHVLPKTQLRVQEIKSHGAAVDQLNLRNRVIHSTSLEEIQRESEKDFAGYFSLRDSWVTRRLVKPGILGPDALQEEI